jgi:hypothetical protein
VNRAIAHAGLAAFLSLPVVCSLGIGVSVVHPDGHAGVTTGRAQNAATEAPLRQSSLLRLVSDQGQTRPYASSGDAAIAEYIVNPPGAAGLLHRLRRRISRNDGARSSARTRAPPAPLA